MKLNEVFLSEQEYFNTKIMESLSGVAENGKIINESRLESAVESVKDWFVKNEVEEISYQVLENDDGSYIVVAHADNKTEAVEFDDNDVIDTFQFNNINEAERFIDSKKKQGFIAANRRSIKNIILLLVGLIGLGAALFFPVMILGPVVTTIAGYLAGVITTIASFAWPYVVSVANFIATHVPFQTIGEYAFKLAVVGTTTVGGWMVMKMAIANLETGDDDSGASPQRYNEV